MHGDEIIPEGDITADQLCFWWKCMRKHSYKTKAEGQQVIAEHKHNSEQNVSYLCEYCDHWHNGRISSKNRISLNKVRYNWRNRNVKPLPETVIAYWNNPKQMNSVFWGDFEKTLD